jgi:nucleoside-diphosphate-sugar epimerase
MASTSDTTVLVTGASGFIAMHCVLALLEAGYRVRGTVRALSRGDAVRGALAAQAEVGGLDLVEADLTRDDGWDDAVRGCKYVLHVASPLPRQPPKHEDDLIRPARDGALRVIRASAKAGVQRVVMTSSLAAVVYGHKRDGSEIYDESHWSILDGEDRVGAYEKSKTIAERAAWELVEKLPQGEKVELVTINPGLVLGPLLNDDWGTSGEVVRKLMRREFPGCPDIGWAMVDVRDVAAAHVAAMTVPEAAGQRFICAVEHASMLEVAKILDARYRAKGYKIPTGKLPGFLMKAVAIFDKTARLAVQELGKRQDVDNSRIRQRLGWRPRSLETMVVDMADSMIAHGVV